METKIPHDLIKSCENQLMAMKLTKDCLNNEERVVSPNNEDLVIEMWIKLWCKVFPYHEIQEQRYRLNQLMEVLFRNPEWKTNDRINIFTEIMKITYTFGSVRLVIMLFNSIKSNTVRSNSSILDIYLAALSSKEINKPFFEVFKSNIDTEKNTPLKPAKKLMDYSIYFASCLKPFNQRSFLTKQIQYVISEEVKLGFGLEKCPKCDATYTFLSSANKKSLPICCTNCQTPLTAKLRVRIGRPIIFIKDESIFWEKEFNITPINDLLESLEKLSQSCYGLKVIDLRLLREEEELWIIIWYCQLYNLPYDLFIPYKIITRSSVVMTKGHTRERTGVRFNQSQESDNSWYYQFKQIRVFALCNDELTQTDNN